jgi:hypothetical protein
MQHQALRPFYLSLPQHPCARAAKNLPSSYVSAAAMRASILINKLAIEQAILFYPALNELAVKEPFKHLLQKLPQAQQLGLGQGPAPSATLTALQQTVKRILK